MMKSLLMVGDFTNLLLEIGSATDTTVYPGAIAPTNDWAQFILDTSILSGSGRIAFRWFGTNAGPVPSSDATATNWNISIDTVSYAIPEPSAVLGTLLIGGLGMVSRRRMIKKNP